MKLHRLLLAACAALWLGVGFAQETISFRFDELYGARTVRGLEYSDKLMSSAGQRVEILGYMAPPLKPELNFFVLTKVPLAVCPFCDSAATWPPDIIFVRLERGETALSVSSAIKVTGTLEFGAEEDPETGFVSLVRIIAEDIERVN